MMANPDYCAPGASWLKPTPEGQAAFRAMREMNDREWIEGHDKWWFCLRHSGYIRGPADGGRPVCPVCTGAPIDQGTPEDHNPQDGR